jgi:small ligand-binding sensory domain FIST
MRSEVSESTRERVDDAVDEACEPLCEALGVDPDVLFVFASARLRGDLARVPARLSARLGAPLLCGCTSDGVLGAAGPRAARDRAERELPEPAGSPLARRAKRRPDPRRAGDDPREPTLVLLGLTLPEGARARPLRLEPGATRVRAGRRPTGVVLLPDPFSADVAGTLRRFDADFPGVPLVGALPRVARASTRRLFLESWAFEEGAVGVALGGRVHLDASVSLRARPIGEPMIVTRLDGPRVLALDGQRPSDVLRSIAARLDAPVRARLRDGVLLGVEMRDAQLEYAPSDFLLREVVRVEPETGALVVSAGLAGYPVVQLFVRDADAAELGTQRALARADGAHTLASADAPGALGGGGHSSPRDGADAPRTLAALMFAHGSHPRPRRLVGANDDAALLDAEQGAAQPRSLAIAGLRSAAELASVHGDTYLHRHTTTVALLRASPRHARGATLAHHAAISEHGVERSTTSTTGARSRRRPRPPATLPSSASPACWQAAAGQAAARPRLDAPRARRCEPEMCETFAAPTRASPSRARSHALRRERTYGAGVARACGPRERACAPGRTGALGTRSADRCARPRAYASRRPSGSARRPARRGFLLAAGCATSARAAAPRG